MIKFIKVKKFLKSPPPPPTHSSTESTKSLLSNPIYKFKITCIFHKTHHPPQQKSSYPKKAQTQSINKSLQVFILYPSKSFPIIFFCQIVPLDHPLPLPSPLKLPNYQIITLYQSLSVFFLLSSSSSFHPPFIHLIYCFSEEHKNRK